MLEMKRCNDVDNLTAVPRRNSDWIKRVPGRQWGGSRGATVVFPHAGGAAWLSQAWQSHWPSGRRVIMQYPQRAERSASPAAEMSRPGPRSVRRRSMAPMAPLRLFGHSMGAVVASSSPGSPSLAALRWNGYGRRRPGAVSRRS